MKKTLEPYQLIERSIIKKYRKELWTPFIVAVKRYELVQAGDRIAVCISGGKDSMLMAKLMQELQRHSDVPFELVFLVMDPGYNEINRQKIESNAELLHIPVTIFESNIFAVANNTDKNPCYLCARMRRGHLYSKAKELGCNKIALGHHFNDVIETTVMSMFYGSQLQAMPPKLHSTSFPGMTLIRPMYCIHEEDILAWKRYNELEFIQCACRFTENCTMCDNGGGGSKRQEVKTLLRRLKRDNPNIENSIFRSIHAVALDTMPGYKSEGVEHSFIEDDYDSEFRLGGRPVPTLFSIDACEKVIYMNTFSKSLTPTIRISYMVLPVHLANRFYEELSFYSCTVSNFEQYTLAAFIKQGYFEKHINRMRLYYARQRQKIKEVLEKGAPGLPCEIRENDSGLHFLLHLKTDLTDREVVKKLAEQGVRVHALSEYYTKKQGEEHFFYYQLFQSGC